MLESKADKLARVLRLLAEETDEGKRKALIDQLPKVRDFAIPEPPKPKPKKAKSEKPA